MALLARRLGLKRVLVPQFNEGEARAVSGLDVFGAITLDQVVRWLSGEEGVGKPRPVRWPLPAAKELQVDLADVVGLAQGKRALEVAAAGGHHLLLVGPPGSGGTLLARRLPGVLPALKDEAALETSVVWSVAGKLWSTDGLVKQAPFRAPHHTISWQGMYGGAPAWMGEVSLAHHGVLFLDDLPEFRREVIDLVGLVLQEGRVILRDRAVLPAKVQLIATMLLCPCGRRGRLQSCRCSALDLEQYQRRVALFSDWFDLRVELAAEPAPAAQAPRESTAEVRARVEAVHRLREGRGGGARRLEVAARRQLEEAQLPQRARDSVLRVAGTIADLAGSAVVTGAHVAEALRLR